MSKIKQISIFLPILFLISLSPSASSAQELHNDNREVVRSEVVRIIEEEERIVPGTEVESLYQVFDALILEGEKEGQMVTVTDDYFRLNEGDKVFLNYMQTIDGEEIISVADVDRTNPLIFFVLLFIGVILLFGRMQGLRSLISLAASFFIIIYLLLPTLLAGYSPVWVSAFFAVLILVIAIYTTHGFNRESHSALAGTVIAILFTAVLSYIAIYLTSLSGFATDEAVYLNLNTGGQLNFQGLLLGAIIIGTLGVLDDIAISQAYTVKELKNSAPHLPKKEIYRRALNVGREHVGSLVNTLALAYAGVALPLLLLFSVTETASLYTLNREIFSTEIIRTIVGSIGVILAVPLSTWIATYFVRPGESHGHSHSHGHNQ